MTQRPFVMYPHKTLRTPAAPVTEITDDIRAIWDEMIGVMDAMPGYGLAAPQLGIGMALAVVDASTKRGQAMRLANPEILHSSVEPCLPRKRPRTCPVSAPRSRARVP